MLDVLEVLHCGCGSAGDFCTRRIGLQSVSSHGWVHDTSRRIVGSQTRSLSRWTRVLGHDYSALLHGTVFGVSQRWAQYSVATETVVSISISISINGMEIEMGQACVGRIEGWLTLSWT